MEKYKLGREDNKAGTEDRNFVFFFNFWLYRVACGILVPWPGMEPPSSASAGGFLSTGKCQSLSRVQLVKTPWTVAHQASLFMGFPRQEY